MKRKMREFVQSAIVLGVYLGLIFVTALILWLCGVRKY